MTAPIDLSSVPILVTGAASGIGSAIVSRLTDQGFPVLATARTSSQVDDIQQATAGSVKAFAWDMQDSNALAEAGSWIRDASGATGLRAIVCCAGRGLAGPLEAVNPTDFRALLEVNLLAQLGLIQSCLPLLRQCNPPGRIVLMGSISAHIALPFGGTYAASKHALSALADSLRYEVEPWGIPVIDVIPGRVATPLWEKTAAQGRSLIDQLDPELRRHYGPAMEARLGSIQPSKMLSPDDVAAAVVEAILDRCPKKRVYIGKDAKWLRLISLCPMSLQMRIIRRLLPSTEP